MTEGDAVPQQLALGAPAPAATPGGGVADPVAEVLVDTPLAHLDRPFEYAVPADLADRAVPGARVRVRFAGKDLDGFVLARRATAEHTGRLAPLRRVVSAEPVLTPHLARLCRDLADHYAGSMADVARLAVPPRHARAETTVPAADPDPVPARPDPPGATALGDDALAAWAGYPAGAALLRHLADGGGPAAVWSALPDAGAAGGWPEALAHAVAATACSGRGSVVVLPDHRDVERVCAALDRVLGPDRHVRLTADLGPQQRYAAWLHALRGHVDVVVGARSAAYAPVRNLGLVAWWDDGDDSLEEPRAPYPHVREVLRRRAALSGAGLLAAGHVRTPAVQQWVEEGRAREVAPAPGAVRQHAPRVVVAGEGHQEERDPAAARARIPSLAWRVVKEALARGPVLVQVPRRGYVVGLSCQECRTPVRCGRCAGPLAVSGSGEAAQCGWCGAGDTGQPCRACGGTARRSTVLGERRTAEEIGRAFAGVPVLTSRAGQLRPAVQDRPAVVVATPGAEPVAAAGYAATLLLDGWALLDRAGLDSGVEAHRRWAAAAALTRGAGEGGTVVLCGVPPHGALRPVEALVRWDPAWAAREELAERRQLGLPPAVRTAVLVGDADVVAAALQGVDVPSTVAVLGPLPAGASGPSGPRVQVVLRAPDPQGAEVVEVLRRVRSRRSVRKAEGELRTRVDPGDLGR